MTFDGTIDEMKSIDIQIKVFGMSGKCIITYNEEGIMRNVNIYLGKTGSTINHLFQIISRMMSTVIRREKKLDKVIERLDEVEIGEPSGFCTIGKDKHFRADKGYAEFLKILLEKYWKLEDNNG